MNSCSIILMSPYNFDNNKFTNLLEDALKSDNVVSFLLRKTESDCIEKLLPITQKHEVLFMVNDNIELAKLENIDGLHLSRTQALTENYIADLRKKLGDDKILGVECGISKDLAMVAGNEGANYVCFNETQAPNLSKWWNKYTELPCVAKGDISWQNYEEISQYSEFIAIGEMVWLHPKGPKAALDLINSKINR